MENEVQLTIDNYDNNGEFVDREPVEVTTEDMGIEPVKYEDLTKEELIDTINNLNRTLESMHHTIDTEREKHTKELESVNAFYTNKVNEKLALINYYERKFKIIKDIITIEVGEK